MGEPIRACVPPGNCKKLADPMLHFAKCWERQVAALERENRELREQDAVHWKTRRSLLRQIKRMKDEAYLIQLDFGTWGDDNFETGSVLGNSARRFYKRLENLARSAAKRGG